MYHKVHEPEYSLPWVSSWKPCSPRSRIHGIRHLSARSSRATPGHEQCHLQLIQSICFARVRDLYRIVVVSPLLGSEDFAGDETRVLMGLFEEVPVKMFGAAVTGISPDFRCSKDG
jgi:hypothetical protein